MSAEEMRLLLLIGTAFTGLGMMTLWWIATEYSSEMIRRAESAGRPDRKRRQALKRESRFYRWFYPAIVTTDILTAARFLRAKRSLADVLVKSGTRHWSAGEFFAAMVIRAFMSSIAAFAFMRFACGCSFVISSLLGLGAFGLAILKQYRAVRQAARKRLETIAIRLPYAVDLISLILDSGGQFFDAVGFVVKEMDSHPLAVELAIFHAAVNRGTPRHEALNDLRDRLGLPIVNELVSTMIQGEINGTPMTKVFQNLAEQMRLKRYQMLESAIARAGVAMSYPGIICMISSAVIILSVFIVPMVNSGFFELTN